jgi:hypothetical protein
MRKIETYGHVNEKGILKISYRSKFDQAVKIFAGRRIRLVVEPLYRKRTSPMNSYYWGVIVNETRLGYEETTGEQISSEAAHELLKQRCNPKELLNEKTGEVLILGGSTTEQTTVEMMEYWIRCRQFVHEWFGRNIPEPNEQTELFK